jgi:hypothetical protein
MEHYAGLDVSLKLTAICIVDQTGKIVREGMVPSDPEAIVGFVQSHAPHVARVGLETGATATWLWNELNALGLPVICIDARHAKAALKMQINKNDRNDAAGLARIMQCGWYKQGCWCVNRSGVSLGLAVWYRGGPLKLRAACPTRSMKSAATGSQRPATVCRTGGTMMQRHADAVT